MEPNHCVLAIRNYGKSVPYPPLDRADGKNHGFMPLKGKAPAEIRAAVREAADLPALQDALVRLNSDGTGVFTIGCEKSFNRAADGFWARGYVEFAINYRELVGGAEHYFKLFFDFNHFLWHNRFDLPVQYAWELETAEFVDAECSGFTATVWLTVRPLEGEAMTREVFGETLEALVTFLESVAPAPLARMY